MIKPLSKVQIIGPKALLNDTLALLKREKVIHPEKDIETFCGSVREQLINYSLSEETIRERILLESLKKKIDEFLNLSGNLEFLRDTDFKIDIKSLSEEIDYDLKNLKELNKKLEENQKKIRDFELFSTFYSMTKNLIVNEREPALLQVIGISLKSEDAVKKLHQLLEEKTGGIYRLVTKKLDTGDIVGIIFSSKELDVNLRKELKELNIPELATPSSLSGLPLSEKIRMVNEKLTFFKDEEQKIKEAINKLINERKKIYFYALTMIDERLSRLKDLVYVYRTENIFSLFGWIPRDRISEISDKLTEYFSGYVILEELSIIEEDKEKIPVIILNPPYLKPFEVLTKILPIPSYRSYDPTPFLGIFFPIFFGIIVGDLGYGLVIFLLSIIMQRVLNKKEFAVNISKVLRYGAVSAIIFGVIFGEFFGDLGKRVGFYWVKLIDREHSITQFLILSVIIGAAHIFIGLILNIFRPAEKKEKLISVALILCILLTISILYLFFTFGFDKITQYLIFLLALVFVFSFMFFGIIFPLELIKSLGNILSYGRIMAIGLSSVILANVANSFFETAGNIFLGSLIAIFLHITNIVLSTFSPSIHSLRLHYVEFFSKFMKFGGTRFKPL